MKLATLTETRKESVEDRLTQIQRDMREVKRRLEKESKDEGEDGQQATKKLKDEGDGLRVLPCNVIQFCQTRNWIFDLDRKKWECSNCYQNGQN